MGPQPLRAVVADGEAYGSPDARAAGVELARGTLGISAGARELLGRVGRRPRLEQANLWLLSPAEGKGEEEASKVGGLWGASPQIEHPRAFVCAELGAHSNEAAFVSVCVGCLALLVSATCHGQAHACILTDSWSPSTWSPLH